ncbi:hypothetical protein ACFOPQ_02355 [Deinococcus antarcticus]|uniref:Uncharacterized protein n=1 Tax=Deinococcus antarcticus TaxID=1298767 RepID=A0ABV8A2Y8_9DEIO
MTDLDSKDMLVTIRQQSARSMFQAPTFEQIKTQLVDELSRRYCQAK